jgi:hypothetical protein
VDVAQQSIAEIGSIRTHQRNREGKEWSYPVSVDTCRLGVMGYEADQLRTGLVKDSPRLNAVDADCTSLR